MRIKIAAVKRANKFSPNHIEDDYLILKMTGDHLEKLGSVVRYYDEEIVEESFIKNRVMFSMGRTSAALKALENMQQKGAIVINPVEGIRNCFRENTVRILKENNILSPDFILTDTSVVPPEDYVKSKFNSEKLWIKRDGHIIHREDIALVRSYDELRSILKEFSLRGIRKAIIQEHIKGSEIKFYAVKGRDFFHWYFVNGRENLNFNEEFLRGEALRAAEALGIEVFGGDAIIDDKGNIYFIDLNDWPSFAPVREEAAENIAALLHEKSGIFYRAKNYWNLTKSKLRAGS